MNYSQIEIKAIDFLKTNQVAVHLYRALKSCQNKRSFKMDSLATFVPVYTDSKIVRLNLVLPTLRRTKVFAGISSALSFFNKLTNTSFVCRIIVCGPEKYDKKDTYNVPGYSYDKSSNKQLLFYSDSASLEIGRNDFFVCTSWKTAYSILPVLNAQCHYYDLHDRRAIYLIQDYEPGFFPWSTEYVLAESTYSLYSENVIAVFNSKELSDYFINNGYSFWTSYYFEPALNSRLKELLELNSSSVKRDKRIILYGRPSEHRNAFELIRSSLLWSKEYPLSSEWEIVSLGENFQSIELYNNTIISKGKVSLDDYANYMLTSYAGISLMVSPHPSYPPLEMSTFGVRTITNRFENKDLSNFNNNIVSLDNYSPQAICEVLKTICDEYETYQSHVAINENYINGNSLNTIVENVKNDFLRGI